MALPDSTSDTTDNLQDSLVIPGYVSNRPEGVFINLPNLYSVGGFDIFVNRMFTGDSRFLGLDYDAFLKLLYDTEWLAAMQSKCVEIKIAAGIVRFLPGRRTLYRPVKMLDGEKYAEYVFEPVSIEVSYEEPVYGEPGEDGVAPIIRQETKTRQEPADLDFDEFVADMWAKEVKYGIDAEAIRKVIADGTTIRMTIANYLEPTMGRDAEIKEVCPGLHRDNSPKILWNGKADLRAFKNRFPQITKGGRLLKKIPRVLGKQGYKVTGEIIEPTIPKDLDLSALASLGTTVVQEKDGEFIVATMDGFLTIDTKSNLISVAEKIETDAGISMRTTGDLVLGVDEFVEHGEVQESRVVEGKHMTFTSDVFGDLISLGGNIRVEGSLSGGRAQSLGGNVTLGRASRAIIHAHEGEITAKYCESCTIVGNIIRIERAVNCEIIGNEIYADAVKGCIIAGMSLKILSAGESRKGETLITMLIPDLAEFDQCIENLQKKIADDQTGVAAKTREIESVKSDQEFAKYLALAERIKSGAIKLTKEQVGNWQKLVAKNANLTNKVKDISDQINALERLIKESGDELVNVTRDRDATGEGITCTIDKVVGQTIGQTMASGNGIEIFSGMSSKDIRILLQKMDSHKTRIFAEDDGSISWKYKEPKDS
ncbi:MAG: FapA family protein [Gallionella sp.]|nr:FapA family protein [Gallionella sp.]